MTERRRRKEGIARRSSFQYLHTDSGSTVLQHAVRVRCAAVAAKARMLAAVSGAESWVCARACVSMCGAQPRVDAAGADEATAAARAPSDSSLREERECENRRSPTGRDTAAARKGETSESCVSVSAGVRDDRRSNYVSLHSSS